MRNWLGTRIGEEPDTTEEPETGTVETDEDEG